MAYFRDAYVRERAWLDERAFGELVALTSLLPGPSSSQLGIAIGGLRAGKLGGLAAWLGFTLPSAVLMTAIGLGIAASDVATSGVLHGLELVAVAVVLAAVLGMRATLAPGAARLAIAAAAAALALTVGGVRGQTATIVAGALVGALLFRRGARTVALNLRVPVSRTVALCCLAVFVALLLGLPVLRAETGRQSVALVAAMFRAGALVFGGGHVVLPLLDESVVEPGWVTQGDFLAGYGAAQAMPGPLFTFSSFLGAAAGPEPNGVVGAAIALVAIFLPSFLLLGGLLPLWSAVRRHGVVQAALAGVGAAVLGLLAAALWDPVIRTAIGSVGDVALAGVLFVSLRFVPVWVVVVLAALVGAAAL